MNKIRDEFGSVGSCTEYMAILSTLLDQEDLTCIEESYTGCWTYGPLEKLTLFKTLRMIFSSGRSIVIKKDDEVIGKLKVDMSYFPLFPVIPIPLGTLELYSYTPEGDKFLGKYEEKAPGIVSSLVDKIRNH